MQVMTVRGPIGGDALGLTLPHEHLFLDLFRITRVCDGLLNDEVLMTQEAARFKASGGSTIVEVTNHGSGATRRPCGGWPRPPGSTS